MIRIEALILLILFGVQGVTAQIAIDEYVQIKFPDEVVKLDTTIDGIRVMNWRSETVTEAFLLQKIGMEYVNTKSHEIPSNSKELSVIYNGLIAGQIKSFENDVFEFIDSVRFQINNLIAYNLTFAERTSKVVNAETQLVYVNENLYVLTYVNGTDFSITRKNDFFRSFIFNEGVRLTQISVRDKSYKFGYILGQIIGFVVVVGGVILFVRLITKFVKYLVKKKASKKNL